MNFKPGNDALLSLSTPVGTLEILSATGLYGFSDFSTTLVSAFKDSTHQSDRPFVSSCNLGQYHFDFRKKGMGSNLTITENRQRCLEVHLTSDQLLKMAASFFVIVMWADTERGRQKWERIFGNDVRNIARNDLHPTNILKGSLKNSIEVPENILWDYQTANRVLRRHVIMDYQDVPSASTWSFVNDVKTDIMLVAKYLNQINLLFGYHPGSILTDADFIEKTHAGDYEECGWFSSKGNPVLFASCIYRLQKIIEISGPQKEFELISQGINHNIVNVDNV